MLTIMGIILGFIILFILIVKYIEYKYNENQKKKFEGGEAKHLGNWTA